MNDMLKHVITASEILGIDRKHMVWLIQEWAERNCPLHNQVRHYISICEWPELAKLVHRDLREGLVLGLDEDMAAQYERVLLFNQKEYFDVVDHDNPSAWFPNATARKLTREMVARQQKK